jgi:1-deoxy-D-xylulose-5-phosphate synthase
VAIDTVHDVDVLMRTGTDDVLIVSVGAMAPVALDAAARLESHGVGVTVVDPGWVLPVAVGVVALAGRHRLVVTIEDGVRAGGVGAALAQALRDADIDVPVRDFGVPAEFLEQGLRAQVLERIGLTGQDIARKVVEKTVQMDEATTSSDPSTSWSRDQA